MLTTLFGHHIHCIFAVNLDLPPHSLHICSEFRLSFVLDDIVNYTTLTATKNKKLTATKKKLLPTKLFSNLIRQFSPNNY